jgi:murein DD-endopeptidase MepM/ murein hydrolase activator NlpD
VEVCPLTSWSTGKIKEKQKKYLTSEAGKVDVRVLAGMLVLSFFSFAFYPMNPPPVASLHPPSIERHTGQRQKGERQKATQQKATQQKAARQINSNDANAASSKTVSNASRTKKTASGKITGMVEKDETLNDIFRKNNFKTDDIPNITKASKKIFSFTDIRPGMTYRIQVDGKSGGVTLFEYAINDVEYLSVKKDFKGFKAKKITLPYQKKKTVIAGEIENNLIDAVGPGKEHMALAYDLADILAADIDFTTDLRKKDSFKMVVEELYVDGVFKGYGNILYARFINNGKKYEAVRYKLNGRESYFDASGKSLRKTLLRAPLRYRYISSGFTYKRMHPILKIFRPHLGVDYVAPQGTPVSTAGDGVVIAIGFKPQDGNQVAVKHGNGFTTYYGHLSRFKKRLRNGSRVEQGDIIGYVGSTGLSTGPHLDYRVKQNNKPVNPQSAKLPIFDSIPAKLKKNFNTLLADMRSEPPRNLVAAR